MNFLVQCCRFHFRAVDPIGFPAGSAANHFRGALGILLRQLVCDPNCLDARFCPAAAQCAYARCFEPRQFGAGPSGFEDQPRPFVLRAASLDGLQFDAGRPFTVDLNLFDLTEGIPAMFAAALRQLEWTGLGPGRPRVVLTALDEPPPVRISFDPESARRIRILFLTPTELKTDGRILVEPRFDVVFARARDRLSQLRTLYQDGPLDLDFRALGERSRAVRLVDSRISRTRSDRRSTRTGQRHALAGFTGEAEYEGELGEFLPILRAASWTGIGRHTMWGLGAIHVEAQ